MDKNYPKWAANKSGALFSIYFLAHYFIARLEQRLESNQARQGTCSFLGELSWDMSMPIGREQEQTMQLGRRLPGVYQMLGTCEQEAER
jgi:hypothetical protein